MYTNVNRYGGNLKDVVTRELQHARGAQIATGYVSFDTIKTFSPMMQRIADTGGCAKLLIGMAFYEGLSKNILELLNGFSKRLEQYENGSGVYVAVDRKYHGKIYLFDYENQYRCYVGSSNFSSSGLAQNIECTILLQDEDTKDKVRNFMDNYLFSRENATSILKADITVLGSAEYAKRVRSFRLLEDLQRYEPTTINKELFPLIELPLERSVLQEKSNLNAYFGKGRWSRTTDKVKPRPWYEVEVISDRTVNSNPLYPKGDFTAYTDDGYIMPMKTQGDYFKNLRSTGSLQIFGMWIKGKLQNKNALIPLTPVTMDTLENYGNRTLRLYKMEENKYYMEF